MYISVWNHAVTSRHHGRLRDFALHSKESIAAGVSWVHSPLLFLGSQNKNWVWSPNCWHACTRDTTGNWAADKSSTALNSGKWDLSTKPFKTIKSLWKGSSVLLIPSITRNDFHSANCSLGILTPFIMKLTRRL